MQGRGSGAEERGRVTEHRCSLSVTAGSALGSTARDAVTESAEVAASFSTAASVAVAGVAGSVCTCTAAGVA